MLDSKQPHNPPWRQRQILEFIAAHGAVRRGQVIKALQLNEKTADNLLSTLRARGLVDRGRGCCSIYTLAHPLAPDIARVPWLRAAP